VSPDGSTTAPGADLARFASGDRSTALALLALVQAADEQGAAELHAIALAHRTGLVAAAHAQGAAAEHAADRMSLDEIRSHLAQVALPRLASNGAVEAMPAMPGGPAEVWRVVPAVWAEIVENREPAMQALRSTSEHAAPRRAAMPRVEGSSVLSAEGLLKSYRRRNVVNNVALEVHQGEIVGLLGPNGAGKTTTFYMIVGLIPPNAGRIRFDGDDITDTPMYRRARRGIGYLSQEPSIFRKLTVEENILAILETIDLPAKARTERLETLLDELGIKHLRRSKAFALSGGERRRLEITRALVTQPKFMLLDEPFAGVDPIAVHDIQQIVASLKDRGIGVLITDHNVEQTLDIVDRAYILFDGQVKVSGTVRDLVFDDTVSDLYLGPTLTARLRSRFMAERGDTG
jgi:lipopolysaccharide export system ATP-binding protein